MKRKLAVTALCLSLMLPAAVQAGDAMKDAAALVPADAIGFVCIPSIKQLDTNFQQTVQRLGLSMFLPPPMNSLGGAMRMMLQMSEGLDENGPLLLVFMPAEESYEFGEKVAILVPATDPKALLMAMGAEAGEGDTWSLELFEESAVAVPAEKHVIFASTAENAKAIAASKESILGKLNAHDLTLLDGMTVAGWFDAEKLFTLFETEIDGFVGMITALQAAAGGFNAQQSEATQQALDLYTTGLRSFAVGMRLDERGLDLRFGFTCKPNTKLQKLMKVKNTEESLLKGLPKGKYLLALGQVFDPEAVAAGLENLDAYFPAAPEGGSIDQEQLDKLKALIKQWFRLHTGFRSSVEALPPGPHGLIGATVIFETTDSAQWIETFTQAIATGRMVCTSEEVQKILGALEHVSAADSGEARVHHLKFDLAKIEEIEEEDLEDVLAVVGEDGLLLRLAAADDKRVVVAFGGGAERMKKLMVQAGSADAPLDQDPGIRRVAALLPKDRNMVMYFAFDNLFALIDNIGKALEEEEAFPVQLGELNAPLAIVGRGGDGWTQADIFIPAELLVAGKDAIMTMVGMRAGPTGGEMEMEDADTEPPAEGGPK